MSKRKAIVILAVWSALVPFLGFPSSWKTLFVAVSGLAIAALSIDWRFLRRKKRAAKGRRTKRDDEAFVEHEPARPAADRPEREEEEA